MTNCDTKGSSPANLFTADKILAYYRFYKQNPHLFFYINSTIFLVVPCLTKFLWYYSLFLVHSGKDCQLSFTAKTDQPHPTSGQ